MNHLFPVLKLRMQVALSSSFSLVLHFMMYWTFDCSFPCSNCNKAVEMLDMKEVNINDK
jgi:hypothetical protein